MNRLILVFLLGFSFLFVGCMQEPKPLKEYQSNYRSDKNVLMFLIDGSGSMLEKDVNGYKKIKAAKTSVRDIVSQIDAKRTNIGLVSFSKGCESVALSVEPSNNNVERVIDKSSIITPSGRTPLAELLRASGVVLTNVDKNINLILVSDGAETCGGDPELEMGELVKKYGNRLRTFVIGYSVDSKTRSSLQRIAGIGNGHYYDALDQVELDKVINAIAAKLNIRSENWSDSGDVYHFEINFDNDSSVIKAEYNEQVEELVSFLKHNNYNVEIHGHADARGSEAYNLKLSQRRAQSVADKIVQLGINKDRLKSIGHGEMKPKSSNDTNEGRFENRRVQAHIMKEF